MSTDVLHWGTAAASNATRRMRLMWSLHSGTLEAGAECRRPESRGVTRDRLTGRLRQAVASGGRRRAVNVSGRITKPAALAHSLLKSLLPHSLSSGFRERNVCYLTLSQVKS